MIEFSKLKPREKKFVEYYLQSNNGSQSAIRAGYSARSSRVIACELLTKPNIRAYVKERLEKQESELVADTNEVLRFQTRMMRGQITEEQIVLVGTGKGKTKPTKETKQASARDRNIAASNLLNLYDKAGMIQNDSGDIKQSNRTHEALVETLKTRKVEGIDDDSTTE